MYDVPAEWWLVPAAVAAGVLGFWVALIVAVWLGARDAVGLPEAARLLPDLVRLITRLAADAALPRGVRLRLAGLLIYLALPIDLVPDFIPLLGYADDVIIVAFVLRSVVRAAGDDALAMHWPGTAEGLAAVRRLCRLPAPGDAGRERTTPHRLDSTE